jgi:hypothetical protein
LHSRVLEDALLQYLHGVTGAGLSQYLVPDPEPNRGTSTAQQLVDGVLMKHMAQNYYSKGCGSMTPCRKKSAGTFDWVTAFAVRSISLSVMYGAKI